MGKKFIYSHYWKNTMGLRGLGCYYKSAPVHLTPKMTEFLPFEGICSHLFQPIESGLSANTQFPLDHGECQSWWLCTQLQVQSIHDNNACSLQGWNSMQVGSSLHPFSIDAPSMSGVFRVRYGLLLGHDQEEAHNVSYLSGHFVWYFSQYQSLLSQIPLCQDWCLKNW